MVTFMGIVIYRVLSDLIEQCLPNLFNKKDKMKKQNSIYIAIVIILAASLACNVGGTTPLVEGGQSDPAATTAPVEDGESVDGPSGPEMIDLSNPAFYLVSSAPAYTFDTSTIFNGVDSAGAAKEVSLLMTEETQTLPQKSQRFLVEVIGGEGSTETVVIGDQGYSVFQGACFPFPVSGADDQSLSEGMPKLQDEITGQAKLVESGVEINGFVTDKYELTAENMVSDDELTSAFVYVASDGGFITRFEMQAKTKTDYQGLDANQPTEIAVTYNYIPVQDGSFEIVAPAGCES